MVTRDAAATPPGGPAAAAGSGLAPAAHKATLFACKAFMGVASQAQALRAALASSAQDSALAVRREAGRAMEAQLRWDRHLLNGRP